MTFESLYEDLRRMARAELSRNQAITMLGATALVNESYLRYVGNGSVRTDQRGEFMAYMARVMRSVIVDIVRVRAAQKRGNGFEHLAIDTELGEKLPHGDAQVLHVHEALEVLAESSLRMVSVVEMRYFAGMNDAEIAEVLNISERTVHREWEKARLILAVVLK